VWLIDPKERHHGNELASGCAVPGGGAVIVELSVDADAHVAIAAVRQAFTPDQLHACPVTVWHGAAATIIGPCGAMSPIELMPDIRSLDVRVHASARVVISWLDGPSREAVATRLTTMPATGLDIRLLREEFELLLADVIEAVYTVEGGPSDVAAHPVRERVGAVRDGRDIYSCLVDLAAQLLRVAKRRGGSAYARIMASTGKLDDQGAAAAALDDIGLRMLGRELFPVRAGDDDATLAAVFVVLAPGRPRGQPGDARPRPR
jgi:hypothetical protein